VRGHSVRFIPGKQTQHGEKGEENNTLKKMGGEVNSRKEAKPPTIPTAMTPAQKERCMSRRNKSFLMNRGKSPQVEERRNSNLAHGKNKKV